MGPWHWPWPLKVGEKVIWCLYTTTAPTERTTRNLRDVAFGTHVPKDQCTTKGTKLIPDITSVGCYHPGGSLAMSYAAGITQIGPEMTLLAHFWLGARMCAPACPP